MRAVILAAGLGRRMAPLGDETPKPLRLVGGRPIMSWTIDALAEHGVTSISVVVGHQAEAVEQFLTDAYPDLDFEFVSNPRYASTNTLASLILALRDLPPGAPTVVAEADVICSASAIADLVRGDAPDAAVVSEYQPSSDGTAVHVDHGEVSEFILDVPDGSTPLDGTFKTVNLYRFSGELCRTVLDTWDEGVSGIDETCYYEAILGHLTASGALRLRANVVDHDSWIEIDDPTDLRVARFRFERGAGAEFVERAKGGLWRLGIVDFAHMTNRRFPPARFLALLQRQMTDLIVRYGSSQEVLDEKLSHHVGCPPERLICLNGASQVYPILADLFAEREVVVPDPTFGEYQRLADRPRHYPDQVGWEPEQVNAVAPDGSVVVFVNPNNPTGTTRAPEEIHGFARDHPDKLIVVDESFIDFAPLGSVLDLVERDPLDNVLVISSMGKTLGLPGVRLGLAYTRDPDLRAAIVERSPIWPVNSIAECVLELLPRFRTELAESFVETSVDRAVFRDALETTDAIGLVHPSGGNFLLVDIADGFALRASEIRARLLADHDLLVKDVSERFDGPDERLRLAVRLPHENERLVECLGNVDTRSDPRS